jgi:hypothetical protein
MQRLVTTVLILAIAGCSGGMVGGGDMNANNPNNASDDTLGGGTQTALSPSAVMGVRRLAHAEYNHTIRDLFGTSLAPADSFPADGRVFGFDNNAAFLSISTDLADLYQQAADQVIEHVLQTPNESSRVLICDVAQTGCVENVIQTFAARALRRPITDAEKTALLAAASTQTEPLDKVRVAVRAVLTSTSFLFRFERGDAETKTLNPYELASRLAFFLWSAPPDETLMQAARDGTLATPAELQAQATRMLADPKSGTLLTRFAEQWFTLNKLTTHVVDTSTYAAWDDSLRQQMAQEVQLYLKEFLESNVSMRELLTADFTYLTPDLAALYGVPAPSTGATPVRANIADPERRGLLHRAALLTINSTASHGSPIHRGLWVLRNLLCTDLPPPPQNVPVLRDPRDGAAPLREQLAQHRTDPNCSGCHNIMDPIGLAFERFDGIGEYIDNTIDASGTLDTGATFNNSAELSQRITDDPRYADCIVKKVYAYAMGRQPGGADAPLMKELTALFVERDMKFREFVLALVAHPSFRQRGGAL